MNFFDKLKFLDIFGFEPKLYINNETRFKSPLTIVISIIFYFILIYFSVLVLIDFFSRKNFDIHTNELFNKSSEINLSNHPFLFYVTNDKGGIISNKTFTIHAKVTLVYAENQSIKKFETEIPIEPCILEKHFKNVPDKILELIKKTPYDLSYCIYQQRNLSLIGHYGNTFYAYNYIKITIFKCVNGTVIDGFFNITRNDCASPEEVESTLKDVYFANKMINYDIDHNEPEPLIFSLRGHAYPFSSTIDTDIFCHLKKITYQSDSAYFFTQKQYHEAFQYKDSSSYFSNRKTDRIFIYRILAADKDISFTRTFDKVWNLFTVIGGNFKFIIVTFSFLAIVINFYQKRQYYKLLTDNYLKNKNNLDDDENQDVERAVKSCFDVKNIYSKLY